MRRCTYPGSLPHWRWIRSALRLGLLVAVGTPGEWRAGASAFDAAPFALPLAPGEGRGLRWEDPREIHQVNVSFDGPPPPPDTVRLQYWGSWWPERHLPKDREPGGGDVGWLELGNWWKNDWRDADTVVEALADGRTLRFRFHPVNAKESPQAADYPATFRYTLKLRVVGPDQVEPSGLRRMEAFTDSVLAPAVARVVWNRPARTAAFSVYNGALREVGRPNALTQVLELDVTTNPDPNTFDRTLVTVKRGGDAFTFRWDDLAEGPLLLPHAGAAVLPAADTRDYAAVAAEVAGRAAKTLRERVADLPEQTWRAAWNGMPRKKSDIYFPLGLDGGRQRFRLFADGHVDFRHNDGYLNARPGSDTPGLAAEPGPVALHFGLPSRPAFRTLAEEALPIVTTRWEVDGLAVEQTAFVTPLEGIGASPTPLPGDTATVLMLRFAVTNRADATRSVSWPIRATAGTVPLPVTTDPEGWLRTGTGPRARIVPAPAATNGPARLAGELNPGEGRSWVLQIPYLVPAGPGERDRLRALDFDEEHDAVLAWWRARLEPGARLLTPEPMLDEFHRSHAMHLLVNCEREPGADRRFARVGSFAYGAYGNESCMMVLDLDRRGFHREARECLDAWLHYQGTVALPGSFAGHDGVLYGAGGYEAGGYNQHHGWILWMLAEHFRFTRDQAWLRSAAPGIVRGADWILRETARTADRHPLERGLLPAGSLEDIGDWWTWLSTSCYTWRGLDNAAWALGEIRHPDANRIRRGAQAYHRALLAAFRAARDRSPVVRLRDGTAVPKVPSHVHRRGRSFGWICETLEGSLHLLITRALDVHSPEADWILDDYEDNLYLSNQYGYTPDDFDRDWFGRGGMSMQACLLLQVEPWLFRDDVKHALRGLFNAQAASFFPDVRMNTEHALPFLDDWRGDHFKSSDEANCAGWLRQLFIREDSDNLLLVGQAVPRDWLRPGQTCGIERSATWFGPMSVRYEGGTTEITAHLEGPTRNPPRRLRVRFRHPEERPIAAVTVDGRPWRRFEGEWVDLPGDLGPAEIRARFDPAPRPAVGTPAGAGVRNGARTTERPNLPRFADLFSADGGGK